MKIIFLDIDGVLNSKHWWEIRPKSKGYQNEEAHALRNLDPEAIKRLNTLLDRSGAVCVLSSTWRTMYTLSKMQRLLEEKGFTGQLFASTPSHASRPSRKDEQGEVIYERRGIEIQTWLDMLGPRHQPDSFVILDDDGDMAHLMPRLVQTHFDDGLTEVHVEKAMELLTQ